MQGWGWIDIFSLLLTLTVCGGAIYIVTEFMTQLTQGVQTTKENMKSKGLTVSRSGMSVKTSKRYDQDEYYAATQRGMMKAFNASTFGNKSDGPIDQSEYERQESVPGAKNSAGARRSASAGHHTPRKERIGKRSSSREADRGSEHGHDKEPGRVHFVKH